MTDWLAWAFYYPNGNWLPVVLWGGFLLSVVFTLFLRKMTWAGTGLLAAGVAFVFFSVMFTAYNGVRSTAALGSIFLWFYLSIVAFPAAATMRAVMSVIRAARAKAQ